MDENQVSNQLMHTENSVPAGDKKRSHPFFLIKVVDN